MQRTLCTPCTLCTLCTLTSINLFTYIDSTLPWAEQLSRVAEGPGPTMPQQPGKATPRRKVRVAGPPPRRGANSRPTHWGEMARMACPSNPSRNIPKIRGHCASVPQNPRPATRCGRFGLAYLAWDRSARQLRDWQPIAALRQIQAFASTSITRWYEMRANFAAARGQRV
jgi:hypothetical protein